MKKLTPKEVRRLVEHMDEARARRKAEIRAMPQPEQAWAEVEDRLEELGPEASFERGDAIVGVFEVDHPRRIEILGREWSLCDTFPVKLRQIVLGMQRPAPEAMTPEEREALGKLPAEVTVWRGCYANNMDGLSWSLERDIAGTFPFLNRYRQPGVALLIEGRVRRDRIIFIKLDGEAEVVCDPADVTRVATHPLAPLREDAERAAFTLDQAKAIKDYAAAQQAKSLADVRKKSKKRPTDDALKMFRRRRGA